MGDIKVDVDVNDTIDSFLDEFEKKDNPEPFDHAQGRQAPGASKPFRRTFHEDS